MTHRARVTGCLLAALLATIALALASHRDLAPGGAQAGGERVSAVGSVRPGDQLLVTPVPVRHLGRMIVPTTPDVAPMPDSARVIATYATSAPLAATSDRSGLCPGTCRERAPPGGWS